MNSRVLTTHVSGVLADKVDEIAARFDRSSDWVVKQAVTAWVEQQEDRYQATIDALADVNNGTVYDHSVIEKWADGLGTE